MLGQVCAVMPCYSACLLSSEAKGSRQCKLSDLAQRPRHRNRAPTGPVEVEETNNGRYRLLGLRNFQQLLRELLQVPAFSIQSLPLICCS